MILIVIKTIDVLSLRFWINAYGTDLGSTTIQSKSCVLCSLPPYENHASRLLALPGIFPHSVLAMME